LGTLAAQPSALYVPVTLLLVTYFSLPANLLIYGVNDIFDYETDKLNAKKKSYESLLHPSMRAKTWLAIIALNLAFLIPLIYLDISFGGWILSATLGGFLFFGIFYSAPPIRAKTKPVLDSFFNILYVFPGLAAYLAAGGTNLNIPIVVAATAWCMAMHAFSAVPDISADREAGMQTVATFLGAQKTLIFCGLLYTVAGILSYPSVGYHALILSAGYVGIMYQASKTIRTKKASEKLFKTYKSFPLLNTVAGMILTLVLLGNLVSF
jgi:4-hydroxybenzoate polyprenyltransferase